MKEGLRLGLEWQMQEWSLSSLLHPYQIFFSFFFLFLSETAYRAFKLPKSAESYKGYGMHDCVQVGRTLPFHKGAKELSREGVEGERAWVETLSEED